MLSEGIKFNKQSRITKKGKIDKRGRKKCKKCGTEVGVRKIICECGYVFKPKIKSKNQISDWKQLKPGDKIKVSGGSFFMSTDDETGQIIPKSFGYTGIATVAQIYKNGIRIFEDTNETSFVYMGEDYTTDIGIYKRAATISMYKNKNKRR